MTELVFVLGTGRCGSTVVHELLARHPEMGFVSNVEDRLGMLDGRDRQNNAIYRRVPWAMTQKGRLRYSPSEGYRSLAREVSPLLVDPVRDLRADDASPWLAARLRDYFERRMESQRQPVFLHKFTGWSRVGLLAHVFPSARFINVVRDGRAVANSWLQMPWWRGHLGPEGWHFGPLPAAYADEWESSGRRFDILAGIAWKMLLDAHDQACEAYQDRMHEIRFEDLVGEPRTVVDDLLRYCGVSWDDEFEAGFDRLQLTSGRLRSYETDLGSTATELLTSSLAGHLRQRGYAA